MSKHMFVITLPEHAESALEKVRAAMTEAGATVTLASLPDTEGRMPNAHARALRLMAMGDLISAHAAFIAADEVGDHGTTPPGEFHESALDSDKRLRQVALQLIAALFE